MQAASGLQQAASGLQRLCLLLLVLLHKLERRIGAHRHAVQTARWADGPGCLYRAQRDEPLCCAARGPSACNS